MYPKTDAVMKQLQCQVGVGQLHDQAWFQLFISTGESSDASLTVRSEVSNQVEVDDQFRLAGPDRSESQQESDPAFFLFFDTQRAV